MNFVRQLSGAFGVNIIAVVLADRTRAYNAQIVASLDPTSDASARYIDQLSSMMTPLNLSEAESYGAGVAHLAQAINTQAAVMAYSVTGTASQLLTVANRRADDVFRRQKPGPR